MSNHLTRRRKPSHGIAFTPEQIQEDVASNAITDSNGKSSTTSMNGIIQIADLFVTMCFYARLGFVQPPTCLRCAHRDAGCKAKKINNKGEKPSCHELVAWRLDANIPLHPDKLEGNVVFITCETATSLANGDAYPSVRWDARSNLLLVSE